MSGEKLKRFKFFIRMIDAINFFRFCFFMRPLRWNGITFRTPLQFYRRIKKKRLHHEWRINKKWRERKGMSRLQMIKYNLYEKVKLNEFKNQMTMLGYTINNFNRSIRDAKRITQTINAFSNKAKS